ncbi:MAG: 4Fe-4S dicluster domain-containing protein [Deltaproteobacteria bacterium]|nr:4Fe-4S dicluster domain-containing protein [Deltaproteobacteria bacterium]
MGIKPNKKISRRSFLSLVAGSAVGMTLGKPSGAAGQTKRYGKLVDIGRCIGCKRCMSACKRWNNLKIKRDELITDRELDLNANNWVVVNLLIDSKNRAAKTYIHWACQHCVRPACVGVCPVRAITKLSSGPVVIDESKCIGCRYCFQACPFKVPRFDFEKRVTRKCHLCYNRIPLLNYMKPACVAACPVGALHFDYKDEIIREAKRRVQRRGGATYIMGLKEAGGTDMLTILPTRPQDLSLVVAPRKIVNHDLDKLRITSSGIMGASGLAGLMYFYGQATKKRDEEPW